MRLQRTLATVSSALLVVSLVAAQGCVEPSIEAEPGVTNDEVVAGVDTYERPEVGTMFVGGGMCTATLIAPDVIISAAHCVDFATRESPGSWGRFVVKRSAEEPARNYTIDRYVSFDRDAGEGDVALLHLATPVGADVARPTCLGRAHPSNGEGLALYGYGCTRRNSSAGSGVKRRFDFAQGRTTTNLCPGDSGGPVMQRSNGAILRINSAYLLDGTGRDIFGDVPLNFERLAAKVRAWGASLSECGASMGDDGGAPPPPPPPPPPPGDEACGAYAGWNFRTCINANEMVRCHRGRLERIRCPGACITRPPGTDDVCSPPAGSEPCNEWSWLTNFTCNRTRETRVLCIRGVLLREACAGGCVSLPPGQDDQCGDGPAPPVMDSGVDSGVDSGASPPPVIDSGVAAMDSGVAPRDAGVTPDPSAPPSAGDPTFIAWPSQHTRSNAAWGAELTDIIRHLPLSYGDTYADADLVTYGHETTHGINSHLRNYRNTTGRRANGFYVMNDRGVILVEPNIRKSAVASFVPASLRGSRFSLYVQGSSDWDDRPLYLFDEWVAYTNGSEVGVGLARAGLWRYGWRDAVAGTLEFVVYSMAVAMAVEAGDPVYFRNETQFRAFIQWNARRAMALYREGAASPHFRWDTQDNYLRALRTSADAEAMRTFVRRVFGRAWAAEVLGLDP